MHKITGSALSAQTSRWLVSGLTLGLLVASAAAWFHARGAEEGAEGLQTGRLKFTKVKDTVNKAAQKVRDTNPSAEQQMMDVEKELHPGG
jgi:hypothetical protein